MLLAGSGHTFEEILERPTPASPCRASRSPWSLEATVAVTRLGRDLRERRRLLPGSDPALKDEYVVFSAHLDHLGVGKPIDGDAIYNGAMDNASGVASLLDVAAMLEESGTKLRRSVCSWPSPARKRGSRVEVVRHITRPSAGKDRRRHQLRHVPAALPAEAADDLRRRRVGPRRTRPPAVAKSMGIATEPDPEPKRNVFIRSDQYSFIRKGVPSLMFKVGYAKGTPEEAIFRAWLKDRYHAPSDDLDQPVDKVRRRGLRPLHGRGCWSGSPTVTPAALEGLVVLQAVRAVERWTGLAIRTGRRLAARCRRAGWCPPPSCMQRRSRRGDMADRERRSIPTLKCVDQGLVMPP